MLLKEKKGVDYASYIGIIKNLKIDKEKAVAEFIQYNTVNEKFYPISAWVIYFSRFVKVTSDKSSVKLDLLKDVDLHYFKNFLSRKVKDHAEKPSLFKFKTNIPYQLNQNYLMCFEVVNYNYLDYDENAFFSDEEMKKRKEDRTYFKNFKTEEEKLKEVREKVLS